MNTIINKTNKTKKTPTPVSIVSVLIIVLGFGLSVFITNIIIFFRTLFPSNEPPITMPQLLTVILIGTIPLLTAYGLITLKKWAYYLFSLYFLGLLVLFNTTIYPLPYITPLLISLIIILAWLAMFVPLFILRKKFH